MTREEIAAKIAELQAELAAMPSTFRSYWGARYPLEITRTKAPSDTHYLEWEVIDGVPRVIGDFRKIE